MVSGQAAVPVIVKGDILVIDEADYCYGIGTLTIRVTGIGTPRGQVKGLEWLGVAGVEIRWDGTDGDERLVLVRTSALANALRRGPARTSGGTTRAEPAEPSRGWIDSGGAP